MGMMMTFMERMIERFAPRSDSSTEPPITLLGGPRPRKSDGSAAQLLRLSPAPQAESPRDATTPIANRDPVVGEPPLGAAASVVGGPAMVEKPAADDGAAEALVKPEAETPKANAYFWIHIFFKYF